MFIQTEATPNPATLKFIPGKQVMPAGKTYNFDNPEFTDESPLAKRLFDIDGVKGVFLGDEFVTVTNDGSDWEELKSLVLGAIMEHFTNDEPVFTGKLEDESAGGGDDESIINTIKDLLDTRVRPAVAGDGGDIRFVSFESGIVTLEMQGACSGCPSSAMTLKHGVETLLRHYVPEVTEVRQA